MYKYFTYRDEVSRTISWGHSFIFLNIFLCLFLGISYLYTTPVPSTNLGIAYLFISWLGHFSYLVFIFYILLFFPLSFVGNLKVYRVLSTILSVILLMIMLVDIKLYQITKIHLNFSVLDLFFEQEGFSTGLNFNFLYIACPILIGIETFFSQIAWKHIYYRGHQKTTYAISSILLLCFLSTHILHIWADAFKYVPITQQNTIFPAYYPMTANTFLTQHGWINEVADIGDDEIERHNSSNVPPSAKFNYPLENIRVIPKDKPFNIVLITLNGMSLNQMNQTYMPRIYNFAAEHDLYTNFYLGNDDPINNAFEIAFGLPSQYMTMAKNDKKQPVDVLEMFQQDYLIKTFSSGDISGSVNSFYSMLGLRQKQIRNFPSDSEAIKASFRWIATWNDRPQMTIISLSAPFSLEEPNEFTPIFIPEAKINQIKQESLDENSPILMNRYFNSLYAADQQVGKIIDMIKDSGHLNDTVVFITSVRGFGIPNYYNKNVPYNRNNYHVPLIISWPDAIIPAQITALAGVQDIAPTIAKEILGIQNEFDVFSTGINLREITNRPWLLSGNDKQIQLISTTQTTIFDKHGNSSIFGNENTERIQPNMATLIKAMKILNRFKEK